MSESDAEAQRVAPPRRALWLTGFGVVAVGGALFALGALDPDRPASRPGAGAPRVTRSSPDPVGRRRVYLGHSVRGRGIHAVALGDLDSGRSVLVVGAIHGNESAGIPIARRLEAAKPPHRWLLLVVDDLNPDGVAAGTRQNAHGVDLNRNFPWHWRPLGTRGDLHYSGPRPLSEPEARAARRLILRRRPSTAIWFHQPLGLVDESGGNIGVERRFAKLTGLPLKRLPRYPGSVTGWQNHRLPHSTAFVVELPPGRLSGPSVGRYADAVSDLMS